MYKGIGLDLCGVARMEKLLEDERFMKRYFAPAEISYIKGRGAMAAQSMAGVYAAKEAYLKAVGTGLSGAPLNEIVVLHTELGQPMYAPVGRAAALLRGGRMLCSISHEGDNAAAVALWTEGENAR